MTATVLDIKGSTTPSLDPLMALVADDMHGVNAVILDRMQSKVALIPELAGHLIAGGGKRMRPMLTRMALLGQQQSLRRSEPVPGSMQANLLRCVR